MQNPMSGKNDAEFKCPSCGEMLSVESKGESDSEHASIGKKPNTASMPMNKLKDHISQVPGMPPTVSNPPNLNSY